MEWIQFVSGIGIGAVVVKLLDIFWLQNVLQRHERSTWLREKRLEVFSDVTKELISFGLHGEMRRSPFETYAAVFKALLLLDDDRLVKRIDHFIVDLDRLFAQTELESSAHQKDSEHLYQRLVGEGREITRLLRNVVLHDRIRGF